MRTQGQPEVRAHADIDAPGGARWYNFGCGVGGSERHAGVALDDEARACRGWDGL